MIKYLIRKASSPFLFLLAFFLLFTCFSFFFIKSKANNGCSLYGTNQVFSLLPFASLAGDAYYRVKLDAAPTCEETPNGLLAVMALILQHLKPPGNF